MSDPSARLPLEVLSITIGFAAIDIHEAAGATQVNTQWRMETSRIRWRRVNHRGFPTIQHLGACYLDEQQLYANLIRRMTFTISVSNNHPNLSNLGFPGLQALKIKQSFLLGHGGTVDVSSLIQPLLNTLVIEGGTTERFLPALSDDLGTLGSMLQLTTLSLRGLTTLNLSNVTETALLHTSSCMPLLEALGQTLIRVE
ncbi:hypothetical protein AUEXF2481DRAFT_32919 [Aureobasidium subglaciale EXF-2481]|uniref:Uncharacterized protein n=1 Tax=Aureobasidium subglaciale (strain EXF-2481) TaxID=1043005 RepID=A0A074Y6F2_AURSE|nr:uncharacterized protein AUEXF2481DRAFT_32919 [Aureobasidium subglaciale EXF-2481]KEQ91534.1 hypothetical protein AUEXF2481DRAFT_32919 [Aureobasidium subglaciale EXF-2481]